VPVGLEWIFRYIFMKSIFYKPSCKGWYLFQNTSGSWSYSDPWMTELRSYPITTRVTPSSAQVHFEMVADPGTYREVEFEYLCKVPIFWDSRRRRDVNKNIGTKIGNFWKRSENAFIREDHFGVQIAKEKINAPPPSFPEKWRIQLW